MRVFHTLFVAAAVAAGVAAGVAAAASANAAPPAARGFSPSVPGLFLPPPNWRQRAHKSSEPDATIHLFTGLPDGAQPYAGLLNVNGVLYGTTYAGGANNLGTVFSVTPSGNVTIVHSFGTATDGIYPYAKLIAVNGTLYGTTSQGGTIGHGTVFSIDSSGTETVIYNFGTSQVDDGAQPMADVLYDKGALYGTTRVGGSDGEGTVFKLQLTGKQAGTESVVYSFQDGNDGAQPTGALILYKNAFYGTTDTGGANLAGTVFKVTAKGAETVLHAFTGAADGLQPLGALVETGGTLYGTTNEGGVNNKICPLKCGTVFSITAAGKFKTIHRFNYTAKAGDGFNPQSGLIVENGVLYGTTANSGPQGAGSVFSITPAGAESVVFVFPDDNNTPPGSPVQPIGGVVDVNGTLYGTTLANTGEGGAGTVFGVPL
jgi:uncharacterized repeat protein (TIGR03803 family)